MYFFDDEYGLTRNSTSVEPFWDSYSRVRHHSNFSKTALASTLFFDCEGPRVELARQLQEPLGLANYGTCLHNIEAKHTSLWRHPERKKTLLGQHKFMLALEEVVEPGWITDPVFDALRVGSVPVYFGDRRALESRVPPNSVIFLDELRPNDPHFVSSLVERLKALASNHTAYFEYHKWRDEKSSLDSFAKNLRGNRYSAFHRMCQFYRANWEQLDLRHDLYFDVRTGIELF